MTDIRAATPARAAPGVLPAILIALCAVWPARGEPLKMVAAESVYGDIARQIGGSDVKVMSVLANPNQDPHEFEPSASTARAIAAARLVIYNGADYDPWAAKLLGVSKTA